MQQGIPYMTRKELISMDIVVIILLLPVASYRITRLITKDTFPPILWLRDRIAGGWRPLTPKEWDQFLAAKREPLLSGTVMKLADDIPGWMKSVKSIDFEGARGTQEARYVTRASWSPYWLAELLSCPWCASAYASAGLTAYGACLDWYTWPMALLVWLYAWGIAAMVASKEWA